MCYLTLQLLLDSISVKAREEVMLFVNVDSSVGRDTEFTFTYTGNAFNLHVVVISPTGRNYTANGPNAHMNRVTKQVTIAFNETEASIVTNGVTIITIVIIIE